MRSRDLTIKILLQGTQLTESQGRRLFRQFAKEFPTHPAVVNANKEISDELAKNILEGAIASTGKDLVLSGVDGTEQLRMPLAPELQDGKLEELLQKELGSPDAVEVVDQDSFATAASVALGVPYEIMRKLVQIYLDEHPEKAAAFNTKRSPEEAAKLIGELIPRTSGILGPETQEALRRKIIESCN